MPNTIPEFFELSGFGNPPAVERIMSLIWQLEDECEQQTCRDHEWKDEDGEAYDCCCLFCEHANGLWWFLRNMESLFEGQVYTFPALCRRRAARAREAGTPRDLEYAAKMEARADELERKAGPSTEGQTTADAPVIVCLNALREEAEMSTARTIAAPRA